MKNKIPLPVPLSSLNLHPFSEAAQSYDDHALRNPSMRWLRRESLRELTSCFQAGDRLLEIGCGTGTEALALARRGYSLLATDAAEGMVEVVRSKLARAEPMRGRVEARLLPLEQLGSLKSEVGAHTFDGAYSSLGALNCTPDLEPVAEALAKLVKPGGYVVISLLNRVCLWETAWYATHLRPRLAVRRWGGQASGTALGGGAPLQVFYWPVAHLEEVFDTYFKLVRRRAFPWLLPPTYAAGFLRGRPRLFALLDRLEKMSGSRWPCYGLGDHVHFTFVRRELSGSRRG
jgi:SAM-dependent methyltransferase